MLNEKKKISQYKQIILLEILFFITWRHLSFYIWPSRLGRPSTSLNLIFTITIVSCFIVPLHQFVHIQLSYESAWILHRLTNVLALGKCMTGGQVEFYGLLALWST